MRQTIKKILKYLLRSLLILLGLLVLSAAVFYVYINTASGKRFLAVQSGNYLSNIFGNQVTIGSAGWIFPLTVELDKVTIKDQRQANMFNIGELDASLANYKFTSGHFVFSAITLKNTYFNLVRYPGDSSSNFGYVIARLSKSSGKSSSGETDLRCRAINIQDLHFLWNDQNQPFDNHNGIDWNHLEVNQFNGSFEDFRVKGQDISADIKNMNLAEATGFVIKEMDGEAMYTPQSIEVNNMELITPYSEIRKHVRLDFDNTDSLVDFIDNARFQAEFYKSKVSFRDIAHFTNGLMNKTAVVNITSLKGTGKINNMQLTDIDLSFGNRSVVRGKLDIKGIPNVPKMYMAAQLKSTTTSWKELHDILPELPLPDMLDKLGLVTAKGNFTGTLTDFASKADFETALGKGNADIKMKIMPDDALSSYSGKVALDGFDLGKFAGQSLLGPVTMNADISGNGLTLQSLHAKLAADMPDFDFNGYNYKNIKVNGEVANKFFKGLLNVNDRNLAMDFLGTVDYSKTSPQFDFLADIQNADLYAVNLAHDSLSLASTIRIKATGLKPDDLQGEMVAKNTRLSIPGKDYAFDSINLTSTLNGAHRNIDLYSSILQAKIDGDYKVSQLGDIIKSAANHYVDSGFYHSKIENTDGQFVNFDIRFSNLSPILAVMRSGFSVSDTGYLKGSIYSQGNRMLLNGSLPSFSYHNLHFKNLAFDGKGDNSGMNLRIKVGAFIDKDTELVSSVVIQLKSNAEKLHFDINATDMLVQKQVWLSGSFDVAGNKSYLDLEPSKIAIAGDNWNITAQRITFYGDTLAEIPQFVFSRGNEKISIDGKYSTLSPYPIRVVLDNVDLKPLANFVPRVSDFSGAVNGQIVLNDLNTKPIVEAALYISGLVYRTDTLGTLTAETAFDPTNNKLSITAELENMKGQEVADATGDITIDQSQALALTINLNQTDIKIFEPFLAGVFSELKGQATASMVVEGTLLEPKIKGHINLTNAAFKVDYTNVKYHFSHDFTFDGHIINIEGLQVRDAFNNLAIVNGDFDLKRLDHVIIALDINASKIQALNTSQKINNLYFGKGFGSGSVVISGPFDDLKFVIKMKTEKGTTFSMPITSGNSFYGYDYIKFINKSNYLKGVREVKSSGIELSMDIDITSDAFGQIIFDPRVGDIIEAHGTGNLRLDINNDGDFNMYGTYTIVDGKYRFTALEGVINKSFTINAGSTITWNGNPYEAQLDMQAIYTVHTSLLPLMSSTVTTDARESYQKVYPVDAELNLKGSLFQPEIRLDFAIQELSEALPGTTDIETRVSQIKNNQQDIDQQVVSLLVLNQFAPVDQGFGSAAGLGVNDAIGSTLNSSVSELVASQVNTWLSQRLENTHVGFDYSNSSTNKSQDEFNLRLSQDILKQRATISVGYDFNYNNYNTQLSYKIKPDGSVQGKVFGRSNNDPLIGQNSNTQGVGITFRKEFDKISELFRKRGKKKSK